MSETTATAEKPKRIGFVDPNGRFHCQCGASHDRGPMNGCDLWRCLKCGGAFRFRAIVKLRGQKR